MSLRRRIGVSTDARQSIPMYAWKACSMCDVLAYMTGDKCFFLRFSTTRRIHSSCAVEHTVAEHSCSGWHFCTLRTYILLCYFRVILPNRASFQHIFTNRRRK